MIHVTKFDGRKQAFDKNKIINTCLRFGATIKQAQTVAEKIEKEAYDGIPTTKILKLIFHYLKELKPEVAHRIDLREAISRLRSKPDFEIFISSLLKEYGYSVKTNQIVEGKCVAHEIDAIATKDEETILVEIKHHLQPHTYTGVDIMLETQARFEDLKEGFSLGKHEHEFSKALVICNTKFSEHALRYAECMGIGYIGWKAPEKFGLEAMIEEKKFYPITLLKNLDLNLQQKLVEVGIVTLKQLIEEDVEELHKKTKISKNKLESLIKRAKEVL